MVDLLEVSVEDQHRLHLEDQSLAVLEAVVGYSYREQESSCLLGVPSA